VLCAVASLVAAASAQAVGRQVFYGKPGSVQIVKTQGSQVASQKPQVIFPAHTLKLSPLASKTRQKICITFQIFIQAAAPSTAWVLKASSPTFCGWIRPGPGANIGAWNWQGESGVPYHAKYVVTWATKKRKLAKASYDFNSVDDYQCVTRFCSIDQTATSVPYISFFG
jgi:hypothetical protein